MSVNTYTDMNQWEDIIQSENGTFLAKLANIQGFCTKKYYNSTK